MIKLKQFLQHHYESLLNSYSMVFFSKDHVFAFILLIITFFDPVTGICGIVSVLIANLFAWGIGFNRFNIRSGFYGFNSLLVGLGLGVHFQMTPEFFILLSFASILTLFLTILIEGIVSKTGLPYLTLSFLFAFWMVTLATRHYTELHLSERGIYELNELYGIGGSPLVALYHWTDELSVYPSLMVYFRSLSAIFFQYHVLAGMLVAAGLLYYSRIGFLLSLIGFYSAYLFYQFIGAEINELSYSYIGFNFILTAIAVGGFFIISSRTSFLWVILLTPLISILIASTTEVFGKLQLSIYSLPFNLIVLIFIYILKQREINGHLELVGFQEFSPERNLYTRKNNKSRFPGLFYLPLNLPFMGEWTVTQGHSGKITHKDGWRHAWDFELTDDEGKKFSGNGTRLTDYYCFNKPVLAPADGWVEEIQDLVEDNEIGDVNIEQNWGNTIIIRHADKLFTKLSHLRKGSFKVTKGNYVKKGEILAQCGNSGRSPQPHIHFQVQANPYIGSTTMDHPLNHYLLKGKDGLALQSFNRPSMGDLVSNISTNSCLTKAFHFIPGQEIAFTTEIDGKTSGTVRWEVLTDIFNLTYLQCKETHSKAYFRSENDLHYFTWFEGDKKSLLFAFYQGAYKVSKGFYRNLLIRDDFPITVAGKGFLKILQDFVAPFYIFIHAKFEMKYISMSDELEQSQITLSSCANTLYGNKKLKRTEFEFYIDNDSIEKIFVTYPDHVLTATRNWNKEDNSLKN
jgi:urea transporter/murein DD-endopeptidase MepM/ murein hydrolase activator NlpD